MTKQTWLTAYYSLQLYNAIKSTWSDNHGPSEREILAHFDITVQEAKSFESEHHLLDYCKSPSLGYAVLRTGLEEYFYKYLRIRWLNWMEQFHRQGMTTLDFACGAGHYGKSLHLHMSMQIAFLDREVPFGLDQNEIAIEVDTEKKPLWYLLHLNTYDLVLMNELLHCKSGAGQSLFIQDAWKVMKRGGALVIGENEDHAMGMRLKDNGGAVMRKKDVHSLMDQHKKMFKYKKSVQITHYTYYHYEKI